MYAAAIGTWSSHDEKSLLAAASHASTNVDFTSNEEATRELEARASEPRCLLVAPETNVSALVGRLRERATLLTVPVIAVVQRPSDTIFRNVFASGADDACISSDRGGITRRLANLRSATVKSGEPSLPQGLALVASNDIGMRRMLGKTLRRAGFDVVYASEARDLLEIARTARALSLVVATDDFPPFGADSAIRSVRTAARKPALPALIVPADPLAPVGQSELELSDASSRLLCFAEEVARRDATDLRASPRLPLASLCAFRSAGVLEASYGLTHNISREGVFVRTLDAPKAGTDVWIELRVPETTQVAHLRGEVVWRREPGAVGAAPFGFGMKLDSSRSPLLDLVAYTQAYDDLRVFAEHQENGNRTGADDAS